MNTILRILNGQFELNDSMRGYEYNESINPNKLKDEIGVYQTKTIVKEVPCNCHPETCSHFDGKTSRTTTEKVYLNDYTLEFMLDNLLENRPLYKDSGLWQIRTDDMEEVIFEQGVNETFYDFIHRVFDVKNVFTNAFD